MVLESSFQSASLLRWCTGSCEVSYRDNVDSLSKRRILVRRSKSLPKTLSVTRSIQSKVVPACASSNGRSCDKTS